MNETTNELDAIDRRLIRAMRDHPRAALAETARTVGIARGTVYSRLDRLERNGVITGYGPDVHPERAGFDVLAFCTLEIAQGTHDATTAALAAIPEILEIHTVTGVGDLLCRVVARSNDHLHDVLQQITSIATVDRSQTQLSLHTSQHKTLADIIGPG